VCEFRKTNISISSNHKCCIEGGLVNFNYKCNLASRIILAFFPSLVAIVLQHNHLVEPGVEGQKVTSQSSLGNRQENLSKMTKKSTTCKPCLGMEGFDHYKLVFSTVICLWPFEPDLQGFTSGHSLLCQSMNDNKGWILVLSGCLSPPMILCSVYFCSHLLPLH